MLQFNMFSLQNLECFEGMINILYKQELGELIQKYEKYRAALHMELARQKFEYGMELGNQQSQFEEHQ